MNMKNKSGVEFGGKTTAVGSKMKENIKAG